MRRRPSRAALAASSRRGRRPACGTSRRARGARPAPGTRGPRPASSLPGSRRARRRSRPRSARRALGPDPLGPGREALVQPDVRPDSRRHRVAEPHVRDLVDHRGLAGDAPVHRARLGLERVEDVRRPVHITPPALERVRAVELGEEVDDRPLRLEPLPGQLGVGILGRHWRASAGRPRCTPAARSASSRRASRRCRWSPVAR